MSYHEIAFPEYGTRILVVYRVKKKSALFRFYKLKDGELSTATYMIVNELNLPLTKHGYAKVEFKHKNEDLVETVKDILQTFAEKIGYDNGEAVKWTHNFVFL